MTRDAALSSVLFRRGFERFSLTSRASVNTGLANRISSLVADISYRGASIVTTVPFDKNEQLEVVFDPCYLFRSPIRRRARVVWCTKIRDDLWQTGVDFGVNHLVRFT